MVTQRDYAFSTWAEPGTEPDKVLASATHAGEVCPRHYLTEVSPSYTDGATSGLLEIYDGSTVVLHRHMHGDAEIDVEKALWPGESNYVFTNQAGQRVQHRDRRGQSGQRDAVPLTWKRRRSEPGRCGSRAGARSGPRPGLRTRASSSPWRWTAGGPTRRTPRRPRSSSRPAPSRSWCRRSGTSKADP